MASDSQVVPREITGPTCMQSINRVTKLPAVESTIQVASNIYEGIKEHNRVSKWALSQAENTVHAVTTANITTQIVQNLEGPIKTVDGVLCSGLDYVEEKIPNIKLPPGEIYNGAKDTAYAAAISTKEFVEPKIKTLVDPVVHTLEPAVERTRNIVEPIVQPAVEKVQQLKEYGQQKVDEYLHKGHSKDGEGHPVECQECQDVRDKVEKKSSE